jgi:hypothetical protein
LQGFAVHELLQQLVPGQQSCEVLQKPPIGPHEHVPLGPQVVPAQQSAELPQLAPWGAQQRFPWQLAPGVQQSCGVVQAPPVALHVHVPFTQVVPGQHSKALPQLPPWATQQRPPWQLVPGQHCAVPVHCVKILPHMAHVPLLQVSEQQSLAKMQWSPSFLHALHV